MREDSCREERRRAACASAATGRGNFSYTSYTPYFIVHPLEGSALIKAVLHTRFFLYFTRKSDFRDPTRSAQTRNSLAKLSRRESRA